MPGRNQIIEWINNGKYEKSFRAAYPNFESDPISVKNRVKEIVNKYCEKFGDTPDIRLFSAPGRAEIGGNHTDHQNGNVLAAAIDYDSIAAAAPNHTMMINIYSEGHGFSNIDLENLDVIPDEINTTPALIRGMAAALINKKWPIRGFDAYISSNVLGGSGLSSSAAFEIQIGAIMNGLFCNSAVTPVEIAKIGKYAENVYFGKPSGLMDQMACSVGGFVAIDFHDNEKPMIQKIDFDLGKVGYALCVVDSGASHADLTDNYTAITKDMKAVAAFFDQTVLRDVDEGLFHAHIAEVRKIAGDRAVLRAQHFFDDNRRALAEAECLRKNDFDHFLELVRDSGYSSFMYLQNVIVSGETIHQEMAYTLLVCDILLGGRGAYRIQGGGFAGTIQAFVPVDLLADFQAGVEKALLPGACHIMHIRSAGGTEFVP